MSKRMLIIITLVVAFFGMPLYYLVVGHILPSALIAAGLVLSVIAHRGRKAQKRAEMEQIQERERAMYNSRLMDTEAQDA